MLSILGFLRFPDISGLSFYQKVERVVHFPNYYSFGFSWLFFKKISYLLSISYALVTCCTQCHPKLPKIFFLQNLP